MLEASGERDPQPHGQREADFPPDRSPPAQAASSSTGPHWERRLAPVLRLHVPSAVRLSILDGSMSLTPKGCSPLGETTETLQVWPGRDTVRSECRYGRILEEREVSVSERPSPSGVLSG